MENKLNLKETLKRTISESGISGHETPVRDVIREIWAPYVHRFEVSPLGNLYGVREGERKDPDAPRRKIALAVHMDGIGMVVERISGEMLYFAPVGGFDPRILPGQEVIVHSNSGPIPGVIVQLASHLTSKPFINQPVPLADLVIDTGLGVEGVRAKIQIGDAVSYANEPVEMGKEHVAGHSLDNRASVAAVTYCLEELTRRRHEFDVVAVGTIQEEVAFYSDTLVNDLRPDVAIVIDVTFASGPGVDDYRTRALASGPAIGFGANIHPALPKQLCKLAEEIDMPFTKDPLPNMSGTDAVALQTACGGAITGVVSIPLRYMHTPVEVITMKDVRRVGRLMAEFISRLNEDSFAELNWEDETDGKDL